MYETFAERLRKSREKTLGDANFVISQDGPTGLWHWVLESKDNGPIACSARGLATRELLLEDLRRVQSKAPQSLVFDLIGNLQATA